MFALLEPYWIPALDRGGPVACLGGPVAVRMLTSLWHVDIPVGIPWHVDRKWREIIGKS